MGLAKVLENNYVPSDPLGFGNRQKLELELEAYRKRYAMLSLVVFACALAIVIGAGYAALRFLEDPGKLRLVYAATGITLAGAFETLRRVTREWGRVDLLIVLFKHADDKDAKIIYRDLRAALGAAGKAK